MLIVFNKNVNLNMGGGVSKSRNTTSSRNNTNSNTTINNSNTNNASSSSSSRTNSILTIEVPTSNDINNNNDVMLTPGVGRTSYRRMVSEDNSLVLATPRIANNELQDLYTSVPYTPCGNSDTSYSYYCPLCMEYFLKILKSNCCSNYTCLSCSITYLGSKGITINTADELLKLGKNKFKDIPCPHCFRDEYQIELVLPQDSIRDYRISLPPNNSKYSNEGVSPLKVGDSFENMKRKMKPFDINRNNSIDENSTSNNKIVDNNETIDENSNDIDYILSKCHSITFVDDDDIDTDTDSSVKSIYKQRYISNVSNQLTSSIIKTVSTKYLINE